MIALSRNRFKRQCLAWYLVLAVCVFPLLGAHLHTADTHHTEGLHPFDQSLHSHVYAHHESIDVAVAPSTDDSAVDLEGESLQQQLIKVLQQAALVAFLLPIGAASGVFVLPRNFVPWRLRPPNIRQRLSRAPPLH